MGYAIINRTEKTTQSACGRGIYVNVCRTAKVGSRFWTGIKIRGKRAKLPPPAIYFIFAARIFSYSYLYIRPYKIIFFLVNHLSKKIKIIIIIYHYIILFNDHRTYYSNII